MSVCEWVALKTRVKGNDETNRPGPRSGHTLTIMGSNAFLYGGLAFCGLEDSDDSSNGAVASNHLYQLKLASSNTSNGMEWQRVRLREPCPIARWRHSATLFQETQILIFGGFHTSEHRYIVLFRHTLSEIPLGKFSIKLLSQKALEKTKIDLSLVCCNQLFFCSIL